MAENCSISLSEARSMDQVDLLVANGALDNYIEMQKKAMNSKKGGK